ncbi:PepSY domain-containing protein [Neobacillus mesonae]|nr:PepSY domain-containing protein [Neobacillus mesonae]
MYKYDYNNYPPRVVRQRLTTEQAKEIALAQVPGQVVHVDMELERGVLVYEFFILTADNRLFEVEVLAKSGKIVKVEEEDED